MTEAICCPLCKQPFKPSDRIVWDVGSGVAVIDGVTVQFSPTEALMFDRLLKSFGAPVTYEVLHNWLYGLRPDGGAGSNVISVVLLRLRSKLKPTSLTIPPPRPYGTGWRLAWRDGEGEA